MCATDLHVGRCPHPPGPKRPSYGNASPSSHEQPHDSGNPKQPPSVTSQRVSSNDTSPGSNDDKDGDEAVSGTHPLIDGAPISPRAIAQPVVVVDDVLSSFLTLSREDDATYQAAHHPRYAELPVSPDAPVPMAGAANASQPQPFRPLLNQDVAVEFPPRAWVNHRSGGGELRSFCCVFVGIISPSARHPTQCAQHPY